MVQMVIIFFGKAVVNSIAEYLLPYLKSIYNRRQFFASRQTKPTKLQQWEEDFLLESWDHMSLFYEYLELVIQFGFVTIFVSAFPLAPLLALINNVFEIRLDAKKMLLNFKRPVAQRFVHIFMLQSCNVCSSIVRVKNIGIWYTILDAIGKLSVFTNSMILAFTTDIIPQIVFFFENGYSMRGYFVSTLSTYQLTDYDLPVDASTCVYVLTLYFRINQAITDFEFHPDTTPTAKTQPTTTNSPNNTGAF